MNELSLFTGAGGGILGSKLLGHKIIGYCEIEPYCQKLIAQRIKDGIFDQAPIFGDIRTFISSGSAELYRGATDVISAGVPCQIASVAGKRDTSEDRNLWPETIECIRRVRPQYAFLENVPGLLSVQCVRGSRIWNGICNADEPHPYFSHVLGGLSSIGYDAVWTVLSASDVGAPHRRQRLWILAYATASEDGRYVAHAGGERRQQVTTSSHGDEASNEGRTTEHNHELAGCSESGTLADPARVQPGREKQWPIGERTGECGESINVADTEWRRCEQREQTVRTVPEPDEDSAGVGLADSTGERLQGGDQPGQCPCKFLPWACCRAHEDARLAGSNMGGMVDGLASRMDLLRKFTKGDL